ncbi:MAG: hypothetical protein U5N53_12650 [Mycobacterium sp.]|nr:hypothetical protein [Mycobacterium sp.]
MVDIALPNGQRGDEAGLIDERKPEVVKQKPDLSVEKPDITRNVFLLESNGFLDAARLFGQKLLTNVNTDDTRQQDERQTDDSDAGTEKIKVTW